jgi:hypothetical protein
MISQKYVSLLGLSKIIRNNSKLTFVGFPDDDSSMITPELMVEILVEKFLGCTKLGQYKGASSAI